MCKILWILCTFKATTNMWNGLQETSARLTLHTAGNHLFCCLVLFCYVHLGTIGCQPPDLTCGRLYCVTAVMQSSEMMAAVSPRSRSPLSALLCGVYFWRQRTAALSICTEQIEPDSGTTSCIQSVSSKWNILCRLRIYTAPQSWKP